MPTKRKIAVVIPTHCHPEIIKLTVGSLIRTHGEAFDLNIHLGTHSNYYDYCHDLSLFEDLRKLAHIHMVDEIDWMAHNDDVLRYSKMHAKNLENLFRQIRYYDFDYVLILDNDVFIKQDFITPLLKESPHLDLAGILFGDRYEETEFTTARPYEERMFALPKICPWHLLISRRLYEVIMVDTGIIYPDIIRGKLAKEFIGEKTPAIVFVDTFGKVFSRSAKWGMDVKIVPTARFEEWAHHFFNSSFNFSQWALAAKQNEHLSHIIAEYNREFPNGLTSFPK